MDEILFSNPIVWSVGSGDEPIFRSDRSNTGPALTLIVSRRTLTFASKTKFTIYHLRG